MQCIKLVSSFCIKNIIWDSCGYNPPLSLWGNKGVKETQLWRMQAVSETLYAILFLLQLASSRAHQMREKEIDYTCHNNI